MTAKRLFLEIGTGNDLHGGDYTKAAIRAVKDAMHHSSLSLLHTLNLDPKKLEVDVLIGVQQPDKIDSVAVREALPHGKISVNAVKGGLDIRGDQSNDTTVIASAAISVRYDLPNLA